MDSIARGLIYRSTHELPLDEPIRAAHRYLNLNEEQVRPHPVSRAMAGMTFCPILDSIDPES